MNLFAVAATRKRILQLAFALVVARCLANLPLAIPRLDLTAVFHRQPYLALLDVFTGGATSRMTMLALGVAPYLLARAVVWIFRRPRDGSALELADYHRGVWASCAPAGVALGACYLLAVARWTENSGGLSPRLLVEIFGLAGGAFLFMRLTNNDRFVATDRRKAVFSTMVLTLGMAFVYASALALLAPSYDSSFAAVGPILGLTAGTMLFLRLGWRLDEDRGIELLTAAHLLAALPDYLLAGASSGRDVAVRLGLGVVATAAYLMLSSAQRRIPTQSARRITSERAKAPKARAPLPLALNVSLLAPVLYVLFAFGMVHFTAGLLADTVSGWIRSLAVFQAGMTDLSRAPSWLLLFLCGYAAKLSSGLDHLRGVARSLRRSSIYLEGVRPGRETQRYLEQTYARLAWIEPLATMIVLTLPGLVLCLGGASGVWPLMLLPVLFAAREIDGFVQVLKSFLAMHTYDGFLKKGSIEKRRRGWMR